MRTRIGAVLVALCLPLIAHAAAFAEPFSLTNTRYGAVPGEARLAAIGSDVSTFWIASGSVRVTRLVPSMKRVGQPVLETTGTTMDDFDVVLMGDRFLVMAESGDAIRARVLDAVGVPIGDAVVVTLNGSSPRLAFNGTIALLLYRNQSQGRVIAQAIATDGSPSGTAQQAHADSLSFAVATDGRGFASIADTAQAVELTMFTPVGSVELQRTFEGAPLPTTNRVVTIASNGSSYLGAWLTSTIGGTSVAIDANGTAGALHAFSRDQAGGYVAPVAVWDGTQYVLAYLRRATGIYLHVSRFDATGVVTGGDPAWSLSGDRAGAALLPHQRGVLVAWNPGDEVVVEQVPLAAGSGEYVTYGAAEQTLLANASAPDRFVVLWGEQRNGELTIHAGVRDSDGAWRERRLLTRREVETMNAVRGAAAAGADGFLVAASVDARNSVAYRLDRNGEVVGRAIAVPFAARGVAWNGKRYAVIGLHPGIDQGEDVVALTIDASGTASSVVTTQSADDVLPATPAIASDGSGFLAVWRATQKVNCIFPCVVSTGVDGTRLGDDLTRLDAKPLAIAPFDASTTAPAATWNGSEYVVAWDNYVRVHASFVTPGGAIRRVGIEDGPVRSGHPRVVALPNGAVAVLWSDEGVGYFGGPSYAPRHRVAVLAPDGAIVDERSIVDGASPDTGLVLAGGDLAYLSMPVWLDAPHHGTRRITLRIATADTPPQPPALVTARAHERRVLVEWSDPPAPANGFRIEYRVGDGAWNEVEGWYGAEVRSATLSMPDGTSFRVRTFSDAGASAPSAATAPVDLPKPKRRAVSLR